MIVRDTKVVMEKLRFLFNFVFDRQVASVTPTSRFGVRNICGRFDVTRPVVVAEYGPGTGVFTRHLIEILHSGSQIIAIERNRRFARKLEKERRRLREPSKLQIVNADARWIDEILREKSITALDYIISGIPFSFFGMEDKRTLVKKTFDALKPGGKFIVYQVSFHMEFFLREHFQKVETYRYWLNIPPLSVMVAEKPAGA